MMQQSWRTETYSDAVNPATEGVLELQPKFPSSQSRSGVMFVHGAGSGGTYCLEAYGRQGVLTNRIVSEGWNAVAGDNAGPQTWGNDSAIRRMDSNLVNLGGLPGTNLEKYALVSGSMGGLNSINYAARVAHKPAAIVTVIPVINIEDIRANNRSGYAAAINSAYPGGYQEARDGVNYNPYTMRAMEKIIGIPMLLIYGTSDTLCLPSFVEAFAAADPTNRVLSPVPYGHEEAAYAAVDHDEVIAFLKEHLE